MLFAHWCLHDHSSNTDSKRYIICIHIALYTITDMMDGQIVHRMLCLFCILYYLYYVCSVNMVGMICYRINASKGCCYTEAINP